MKELEGIWKDQMPQVSRVMMSLLGPGPDVWKCAGRSAVVSAECATSWREWGEARDRSGGWCRTFCRCFPPGALRCAVALRCVVPLQCAAAHSPPCDFRWGQG